MCRLGLIFVFLPGLAAADGGPVSPYIIAPSIDGARISVTVEKGLRSSKRLRSAALRKAREDFHDGLQISADAMRQLADAGAGLAAQRYVRVLTGMPVHLRSVFERRLADKY